MNINLNTKVKDLIKDERSVKIIEEFFPNFLEIKELKYFYNCKIKMALGKGKYVGMSNEEVKQILERIIQKPIILKPKVHKKIKKLHLKNKNIKMSPMLNTYNETAVPLTICNTSYKNIDFILEQEFLQLTWDDSDVHKEHCLNYKSNFINWKWLHIKYINDVPNNNIINEILYFLNKGYYIYLFLNEKNIMQSKAYGTDYDHDYCIYGADISNSQFYMLGYNKTRFAMQKMDFSVVKDAYINQVTKSNFFVLIKPKMVYKRKNSKKQIIQCIKEFYFQIDKMKGINCFDRLYEFISREKFVDIRYVSVLKEHSILMFNTLKKINMIDLAEKYHEIFEITEKLFLYALKLKMGNEYKNDYLDLLSSYIEREKQFKEDLNKYFNKNLCALK